MKKFVILGSSSASVTLVEHIRRHDQESEITLLSCDGHYPYQRDQFASFIDKSIEPEQVFSKTKDFYDQHNVKVLLDKKITRINIKRRKIFTEDKEQIDYDTLIVTDTPENRFPKTKGTNKTGVFGFKKLNDIDQIVKLLPLVDTVAIQSESFSGFQAAVAIAKREREVLLVTSKESFLAKHFYGDVLSWLTERFEEAGIRIMYDNSITEVLGDKDAKAIQVKEGKVFSAQIILYMEMDEDLRIFSDTDLKMDGKIEVNQQFRTNNDTIFAIDQSSHLDSTNQLAVSEPITPPPILDMQAKTVNSVFSDQEQSFDIPVLEWKLEINGLTIIVIGQTTSKEGESFHCSFDSENGKYTGLYLENNCVVGAVLVNAADKREGLLGLIEEKRIVEVEMIRQLIDGPKTGEQVSIQQTM